VHEEAGADGLNLDPNQTRQARTKSEDAERTARLRLAETYQWVLAPEQPDPTGPVTWSEVRVEGPDALAVRAGRRLVASGQLYEQFPPSLVRKELNGPLASLWADGHVDAGRLWDTFSRYLYLPRLLNQGVLLAAVAEGPASLTWQSDGFATADGHDGTRYLGLVMGEGMALAAPSTLLVQPGVALSQSAADAVAEAGGASEGGVEPTNGGGSDSDGATPGSGASTSDAEPALPTRFFAVTEIGAERMIRDFGRLAQEVVQNLTALDGTAVTVRVEIEAVRPDGFPDHVVRTVTENAFTLKITDHGFESD
jgi:hypothetical protein